MKKPLVLTVAMLVLYLAHAHAFNDSSSESPLTAHVLPMRTCSWCALLPDPEREPARSCDQTCTGQICYIVVNEFFNLTLTAGCLNTSDAALFDRVEIENICHRSRRSTICACATVDRCNSPQAPMASFAFVDDEFLDQLRVEAEVGEEHSRVQQTNVIRNNITDYGSREVNATIRLDRNNLDGMKELKVTIGSRNETSGEMNSSRETSPPDSGFVAPTFSSLFSHPMEVSSTSTEKIVPVSEIMISQNTTMNPLATVEEEIMQELALSLPQDPPPTPKYHNKTATFGFNFTVPIEVSKLRMATNDPAMTVNNGIPYFNKTGTVPENQSHAISSTTTQAERVEDENSIDSVENMSIKKDSPSTTIPTFSRIEISSSNDVENVAEEIPPIADSFHSHANTSGLGANSNLDDDAKFKSNRLPSPKTNGAHSLTRHFPGNFVAAALFVMSLKI